MPNNAFTSPRAARRLCTTVLTLSLCAVATAPAASAGQLPAQVAHAAQSPQRAQARAERKLLREARRQQRRAARQERRSARRAEHEARQATRASRRAERAAGSDTEEPTQNEVTSREEHGEAPKTEAGAPRSGVGHGPCTLSAQASSAEVTAGATVTISGKLTCPSTIEAGGQEVIVSQRGAVATTSGLSVAGTAITQADGSYEVQSAQLQGRSVFIARSPGAQREARVLVTVGGALSLQGPAVSGASLPMGAGKSVGPAKQTFTGTVAPAEAGRQVALAVRYGSGEWRTVAFARTDEQGNFTFSHRFRFAGEVSVMASARPRGELLTRSTALAYTIVQAQNPAVTIALAAAQAPLAPAAGLASAESVTIAGVAAGCAQHLVTLLSRSPAGGFSAVASTQADATGAYSFTLAPTVTSVYAVKCGRSRSTLVRREVLSSPPVVPAS